MKLKTINIKGKEDTPFVILDSANDKFEISGRSLPEDAAEFYEPIIDWIDVYTSNPNPKTNLIFKLEYFNTSSAKQIYRILSKFEILHNKNHDHIATWYYQKDDKINMETGERFIRLLKVPIKLVPY